MLFDTGTLKVSNYPYSLFFLLFLLGTMKVNAQPVFTNFTPSSGPAGAIIAINGSGFGAALTDNTVYFGGVKANVLSASSTGIAVAVPTGFTCQPLSITTNHLTIYTPIPFAVTFGGSSGPLLDGSFATKVDIAAPNYPQGIAIGDLNGDGKPELVTANYLSSSVTVFKNGGVGGAIDFSVRQDFGVGSSSGNVVIGDLDGDGLLDLVVANKSSKTVSIIRNTSTGGTISFAAKIDYSTISDPYGLAIGEINGDGKLEIIIANNSNGLLILPNNSSPGIIDFNPGISIAAGPSTSGLAVGDINADGKTDLITCNQSSNTVAVLSNTTTGGVISFAPPMFYATGASPYNVAVGDLDLDGKLDIAVCNINGSTISVFRNNGAGTTVSFTTKQDFATGTSLSGVLIANINGDDKPEIVTANNLSGNASILKNVSVAGAVYFDAKINYATANNPWQLAAGDVNNDGMPDIVTVSTNANIISILLNKIGNPPTINSISPSTAGTGAIITMQGTGFNGTTAVTFGGIAASSFTVVNDNLITAMVSSGATGTISITTPSGVATVTGFTYTLPPLITSVVPTSGPVGQRVKISGTNFSTNPNGNFVYFGAAKAIVNSATATSLTVTVPAGATYEPISVTTQNYSAWSKQPFRVLFKGGTLLTSTFVKKIDIFVNYNENPGNITIVDLDGDGKSEVVEVNPGINAFSVFRNATINGVISFAGRSDFNTGSGPVGLGTGDFDCDGKIDIVITNEYENTLSVFKNTSTPGSISFGGRQSYYTGGYPSHVAVADIDGDGKPDLSVTHNSDSVVAVFRNISTPSGISFSPGQTFATKAQNENTALRDVDGDGKVDLLVANACLDSSFSIFRNTSSIGSVSFASRIDYKAPHCCSYLSAADMDNDGKTDIILMKGEHQGAFGGPPPYFVSIFRNQSSPGNLLFANSTTFQTGQYPYNLAIGDVDGDGRQDMMTGNHVTGVSVLKNQSLSGNMIFAPYIEFLVNANPQANPHGVAVGDLDGDGKPDIAVANNATTSMAVLINQNGSELSLCPNGAVSVYSNVTGSSYQWQVDTGAGFVNLVNNINYSGTSTAALQVNAVPSAWSGYRYRCVVNGLSSKISTLKFSNTWIGAGSTAWENAGNWSCGAVPDSNTDVIINTGTVIVNSNIIIRTLRIDPDVSFTVNQGYTVTVSH